jgi:SAM-dependent methyltransferase
MSDEERTPHGCPLCLSSGVVFYWRDQRRDYWQCHECQLIFVPRHFFLTSAEEKAEYDKHQNDSNDNRYRGFLTRIAQPVWERQPRGSRGLDFGCGPGPTLSLILREKGLDVVDFDPIYVPDANVWQRRYDFITASEVLEHCHDPRMELERLWQILRPNGLLAIMTKRTRDKQSFATWHYKNDPTHVMFYNEATFAWMARHWRGQLELVGPDVVLLHKLDIPCESSLAEVDATAC